MTEIGHNAELSAEQRRVLFSHYHRKDRDIAAQMRALAEEKKSNRQNAKASGFPAAKMDHYLKSFLAEDQQKPVDKLKTERENLEWLGFIPATSGGDLMAQIDRVDGEQMIQAKGYHAGLTGMDRVSGYDGGSSDDKLWLESYDAGKAEFEVELPKVFEWLDAQNSKEAPPADGDDPFPDTDTPTIN